GNAVPIDVGRREALELGRAQVLREAVDDPAPETTLPTTRALDLAHAELRRAANVVPAQPAAVALTADDAVYLGRDHVLRHPRVIRDCQCLRAPPLLGAEESLADVLV